VAKLPCHGSGRRRPPPRQQRQRFPLIHMQHSTLCSPIRGGMGVGAMGGHREPGRHSAVPVRTVALADQGNKFVVGMA
jgi:hypothetical protein